MTINEEILDGSIRHMVWLERYKTSTSKKILTLLNKADDDLIEKIAGRLVKIEQRGFDLGKQTTERLKALEAVIRDDRKALYQAVYGETRDELFDFAVYESDFQARLIETAAQIELVRPAASQLKAAATSQPFRGRLLKEWYSGLEQKTARQVNDAVRIGIVEGETTDQIVRRIKGTRARQYRDGVLDISRRDANAVVRTAVSHVSNRAANDVWDANADIIKGVKWISTLDGRTSAICRQRDNKIYAVGKAPAIPAHFNCRSTTVPYLGEFKTKGNRASKGGPVPEDTSYGDWLRKQPNAVQEEVLGVKKAQLFRKGDMSIDRFQDATGKEYTLAELKKRDSEIWNKVFN